MDLTRLLDITVSPRDSRSRKQNAIQMDETSCGSLCQHPSCWASLRRFEKGVPRVLPPLDADSDDSDEELSLPKQSVCNLLADYGENNTDRYPLSTGGRPSHYRETPLLSAASRTAHSLDTGFKLNTPYNTKISLQKRSTRGSVRNAGLRLVEVQEVFDREDLKSQWDETFYTKKYYVWVPNPNQGKQMAIRPPGEVDAKGSQPVLLRDMTECMVPSEIEQKREDTIVFDEWPVLKKKQQRGRSPPSKSVQFHKPDGDIVLTDSEESIDTDGINELLALPRESLLKVLEQTKKSDFTSRGKLHSIVQECVRHDDRAQMALNTRELFKHRRMKLHQENIGKSPKSGQTKPVFQLDDDGVLDRMSVVNSPTKDKDVYSEADSYETFPRFKRPLPGIYVAKKTDRILKPLHMPAMRRPKIPSISLGLPELPSGVKTTRPFSYKRKDLDFSLGPVLSTPSSVRSAYSGDYSEHGTTIKVNVPSTVIGMQHDEMVIHSVSPALSTHVPMAPAGTPATFQSPTKSAPAFREMTQDTSHLTINTSQNALPPSREHREDSMFSPAHREQAPVVSPMENKPGLVTDEEGLDTINETARENQGESLSSSRQAVGERVSVTETQVLEVGHTVLRLETSTLKSVDAAASPREQNARSVESCPSPEQWPLISELSIEQLLPRPSVSEPALSARSDRRRPISRGKDDGKTRGAERDYARKFLDEKRKAESPAPPPPSPEPKDPGEKSDYRSRKDLKSRDSLSMAPLFEVNEMEESSPRREMDDRRRDEGRQEMTRRIEVTVPMGRNEGDVAKEKEKEGEFVSQITVLHITPKVCDPNNKPREKEKVQETFLNVDIPAEDISSLKAEHGSSHQEDISSNDTVVKSHSTTTGSECTPTPRDHGSEVKGESLVKVEENEEEVEQGDLERDVDGLWLEREDRKGGEGSGQDLSEGSNMSPEMMCDSARFISHETVSPVEGELAGELTLAFGTLEEGDGTEGDSQVGTGADEGKEQNIEAEIEAPGSFFFTTQPKPEEAAEEAKEINIGELDVEKEEETEILPEDAANQADSPGQSEDQKNTVSVRESQEESSGDTTAGINVDNAEDKDTVRSDHGVATASKEGEELVSKQMVDGEGETEVGEMEKVKEIEEDGTEIQKREEEAGGEVDAEAAGEEKEIMEDSSHVVPAGAEVMILVSQDDTDSGQATQGQGDDIADTALGNEAKTGIDEDAFVGVGDETSAAVTCASDTQTSVCATAEDTEIQADKTVESQYEENQGDEEYRNKGDHNGAEHVKDENTADRNCGVADSSGDMKENGSEEDNEKTKVVEGEGKDEKTEVFEDENKSGVAENEEKTEVAEGEDKPGEGVDEEERREDPDGCF